MGFGNNPTTSTQGSLPSDQIYLSSVATPDTANGDLTALEGGPVSTDTNSNKTAPASVYLKDGRDVTQGAKADTASTDATTSNTKMAFLKGLVKMLADIWDSTNHRVRVDGSGVTQPVSAASLPLPSGAATSAKQPALGTAGTASADVLSVQGVASMTALKTDGSGVTQPVSGTVSITANSAVNVAQVGGTTTDTNSGSKSAGTQRIVIATDQPQLTNALKVDGSGVTQPVSGTVAVSNLPGTQPVSGTVTANAGTGTFTNQQSNITSDYDTGAGTQNLTMFGVALPASGGSVAGGTSSNPLRTDPTGVTTQPVSGSVSVSNFPGTQPISGTITANAGTNLNTSLLALESGGNLAAAKADLDTIVTNTNKIPASPATEGGHLAAIDTSTAALNSLAGTSADASTVASFMGRLTKIRDLLLGFVFDNTDRLKTSLYVKTSAAADTILTLGRTTKAGSLPVTMASDQDNINVAVNAALPAGSAVIGSTTIQATSGTALAADQSNTELRTSIYGKNSTAGDTALSVDSSGRPQVNIQQIGGVTAQMSNSDGVNPANLLEHGLALYTSGGPVDSSGKPQQLSFDRMRMIQGKAVAGSSGNITSTVAGDVNLVFGSAPKTIMPGQAIGLAIGSGNIVEYVYVSASFTPSSSATSIPLQTAVVNSGSTTAKWDIFSANGPGTNDMLPTGIGVVTVGMYNTNNGLFDIIRGANGDAQSSSTFLEITPGLFNGSNTDRQRNNMDNIALLASAARTTTQTVGDQINYNGRGVIVVLDMTVVGTGSVTLEIDGKDPVSGKYYAILTGAAVVTNSTNVYKIYPGITTAANAAVSDILPRTWRVVVTANNANSATYSVGAVVIL